MAVLIALLAIATAGVAFLLALASALAAQRARSLRFAWAALAFAAFCVKSVLVMLEGGGFADSPLPWNGWSVGFDAAVLALLYLAIVQR